MKLTNWQNELEEKEQKLKKQIQRILEKQSSLTNKIIKNKNTTNNKNKIIQTNFTDLEKINTLQRRKFEIVNSDINLSRLDMFQKIEKTNSSSNKHQKNIFTDLSQDIHLVTKKKDLHKYKGDVCNSIHLISICQNDKNKLKNIKEINEETQRVFEIIDSIFERFQTLFLSRRRSTTFGEKDNLKEKRSHLIFDLKKFTNYFCIKTDFQLSEHFLNYFNMLDHLLLQLKTELINFEKEKINLVIGLNKQDTNICNDMTLSIKNKNNCLKSNETNKKILAFFSSINNIVNPIQIILESKKREQIVDFNKTITDKEIVISNPNNHMSDLAKEVKLDSLLKLEVRIK